jgi:hypothetical protein
VFLRIIHRPTFYLKQRSGDWQSPEIVLGYISWAQLSRFLPEDGDRTSLRTVVLNKKKQDDELCPNDNTYSYTDSQNRFILS